MEITIDQKQENVLLNRTEVKGQLSFEKATPSNQEVAEAVAKELDSKVELVVVKHIYTRFGHQEADFEAVVYKDQEAKDKIEKVTKHLKKQAEAGKKAEEAPQEEAKGEEKKEEPKAEEKPEESAEEKKEEVKEEPAEKKPAEETKAEEKVEEPKEKDKSEEEKAEEQKEEKGGEA